MKNYSCKCGERQSYGSMPPNPCDKCEKCGSDIAIHPDFHSEPKPHDWHTEMILTDEGEKPLTKCSWCGLLKIENDACVFEKNRGEGSI